MPVKPHGDSLRWISRIPRLTVWTATFMVDDPYNPLTAPPYPLQRALDYQISAWSEGYSRIEMQLGAVHENRHGIPHGGIYAVLIDTAAGFSGTWRAPPEPSAMAMTLSMTVNFIGLPQGKRLIAEGRKVGGGRNIFFSEVVLKDELGTLIATGSASLRYRSKGGNPVVAKG